MTCLIIGAAFVPVAIGSYYYIGPGPGNLDQFALWSILIGSLPFWLFGAAVGGFVTEFKYDSRDDMVTLQVRWYGRVTASHTGDLSDVELILRPVIWNPDDNGRPKGLWAGLLVLKGHRMLAVAVSERADVVLEHMESLGKQICTPVRIEEADLHIKRL